MLAPISAIRTGAREKLISLLSFAEEPQDGGPEVRDQTDLRPCRQA